MNDGISIIIPTYNGGRIFSRCLDGIRAQAYGGKIQLIIIDSGSTDGTAALAANAGAFVKQIDRRTFHHAKTRNEALAFATFDSVVYTVQDVIPFSTHWLTDLKHSLDRTGAAAVYTDQVPHDEATAYARFENECIRKFRGEAPVLKGLASVESFRAMPYHEAYFTIGLDNVCAIYRKELLAHVPFPEVGFAEDLAWALKIMLMGGKVLYDPNIKVKHSHNRQAAYLFDRLIVNAFWCAKIMNRVRDDMSFLGIPDLLALTRGVKKCIGQLTGEILGRNETRGRERNKGLKVIDQVVGKYSLKNRMKWFLMTYVANQLDLQSPGLRRMGEQLNDEIRDTFDAIRNGYDISTRGELMEVLGQVAASVLGRIYGEVLASHVISGSAPSAMTAFMRPYMGGI